MPNVLEVQIIGDVSALEKSLKQAEKLQAEYTSSIERTSAELKENIIITNGYKKAIEELNSAYKNGSISSKEYSSQLANLKRDEKETTIVTANLRKELAELKRTQKDLGGSISKDFTPKVANGSNALVQFSRIAQDAPYGIQGVANNLTVSAEAFSYLVKQTGSATGALKALGASLLGGGGILLAVSLVTTALTIMSQKGLTVGDVFKKLTGTFDENAESLKKASIEGAKAASEEIITMKALVDVSQNEALSKKERLIAVEKLQQQYPAYFGNLSKEQILTGDLTSLTNDLTKALISKSIAEKLASDSADIQLKVFQKNAELVNAKNKTSQLEIKLAHDLSSAQKTVGISEAQLAQIRARGVNSINASKEAEQEARDEILKGTEALKQRQNIISKFAGQGIKTEASPAAKTPKTKKAKEDLTPKVTAIPLFEISKSTDDQNDKILANFRDNLSEDLTKLKTEPIKLNIPLQAVTSGNEFEDYASKLAKAKEDTQIFADGAGSAIGTLASELASSLETGNAVLDSFVGSVIQGLAQIASAQLSGFLAQQVLAKKEVVTSAGVSTAKAIESGTKTAAASGPAAAFVLPALVGAAIGFIAAAFSGIKFAHGGIVPGGSFTGDKIPAMLNSGEAVMNQQQQANTLMAIANGNSNSLQGNVKSDSFNLETKIRGSDIFLSMKREERSR